MTPRRAQLRLRVDPVACDAFGYCAELLPERVRLDEWGYPIVDGTPVGSGLVELARRAAAECPRRAILVEAVPVDAWYRAEPASDLTNPSSGTGRAGTPGSVRPP